MALFQPLMDLGAFHTKTPQYSNLWVPQTDGQKNKRSIKAMWYACQVQFVEIIIKPKGNKKT